MRVVQLASRGQTAVTAEPLSAVTGDGRDDPAGGHLPNPLVACVGNEQVARCIHRHSCGAAQLGSRGQAAVTAEPRLTVTSDGTGDGGDQITASGLSEGSPAKRHCGTHEENPQPHAIPYSKRHTHFTTS